LLGFCDAQVTGSDLPPIVQADSSNRLLGLPLVGTHRRDSSDWTSVQSFLTLVVGRIPQPTGGSIFQRRRSAMKVKEAMHKGVEWVGPDAPVIELAKLMREHDVGAIPIGENDQLIGMVTDRDIVCKGLAEDGFDPGRATARDVMTPGIHCCSDDDDLAKAVRHMEELKVRRLPVINKNKRMVGILSLGDVSGPAPSILLSEYVKSVSAHHQ
jgi:CBS domain-containing protein